MTSFGTSNVMLDSTTRQRLRELVDAEKRRKAGLKVYTRRADGGGFCAKCGQQFSIPKNIPDKKFCSRQCRMSVSKARQRQRIREARGLSRCPICEESFSAARTTQKYCSKSCRDRSSKRVYRPAHVERLREYDRMRYWRKKREAA